MVTGKVAFSLKKTNNKYNSKDFKVIRGIIGYKEVDKMSIGSASWQPTLTSSLQQELNNLENSAYVGQNVSKSAGSIYSSAVQQSLPLIAEQGKLQSQVSSLQSLQSSLQTLQSAIQT